MQHKIPTDTLGAQGEAMAQAVEACVHCGFCLPACPTYQLLGEEMDSPRGRIFLMKEVLEGGLPMADALPYIDKCLGCLGCVTACPSGVQYGELVTPFKAMAEASRSRAPFEQLSRTLALETLPYPGRFRVAAQAGQLAQPFKSLVPAAMRPMLELLPSQLPAAAPLPEVFLAVGERRARVAMLAGCAQQVLAPEINWATLRVLARNGIEVVIPKNQSCCGAIVMHAGAQDQARALARHNLNVFPSDVDAVITNAAGCGSGMHEYGLLFAGQPELTAAQALAKRTMDVTVFLERIGLSVLPALPEPAILAYHDACHLAHAQGVRSAPRALLASVGNLKLLELADGELCCGSAGTYNITQPEIAARLGERKARAVLETGAEAVASGNIGCLTQLHNHLGRLGHTLPVMHTLEVLDRAYRNVPLLRG
jgi:glycolate oxidase iron-sulfur subunit